MNRMRRRIVAGSVAAAATAAMLAGCTPASKAGSDSVITVFAPQDQTQNLATNSFTKLLEKKFNVKFTFETTSYDSGSAAQKRQISLASGDYPDVYWLIPWVDRFNQAELLKLGQQGVILKLNDLIQEDAPDIQKAFAEEPELKTLATSPDGSVWGLPQWNDCFHCGYSQKLWLNSTWLTKLGLKAPTTPAELENVLEAFKNDDPNGNGQKDEIPLTDAVGYSPLPYLMNPFVYVSNVDPTGATPASLALDGNKVVLQATKDGWREGLKYVHELWQKGLIDSSAFSQNPDAMKAKGDNASAVIAGSFAGQHPAILLSLGQKDGRDKQYDAVPPLKGPNGSPASYILPSYPGASFVITNKASAEKQKKLIQILDYIYSTDGTLRGQFGIEGLNWAEPAKGDAALDGKVAPLFKMLSPAADDKKAQNNAWGALTQFNSNATFRGGQVVPTDIYDPSGYERRLFEATQPYAKQSKSSVFPYWNVWVSSTEASQLSSVQTNVESNISQASAEFVTGTRDINSDAAWAQFQSELKANGADTYVSIYQQAWDKVKK